MAYISRQESGSPERGKPYSGFGRKACYLPICGVHPRGRKLTGRLLKLPAVAPRGVLPTSRWLSGHLLEVGYPGCRSSVSRFNMKLDKFFVQNKGPALLQDSYLGSSLESVFSDLCISSSSVASMPAAQGQKQAKTDDPGCPGMAQEVLVCRNHKDVTDPCCCHKGQYTILPYKQ